MNTTPTLFTVGAALVDIIASVPDEFLRDHKLRVGGMQLSTLDQAETLYDKLPQARESAGGSAANTAALAAALGANAVFLGKTGRDQLGRIFRHDMRAAGVHTLDALDETLQTGRCLSMVTPDAQRTMSTYLGASTALTPDDCQQIEATSEDWVFLESYMLDTENGRESILFLMNNFPGSIALTLSDARCVERHHAFIYNLLGDVDLIFGNEEEIVALGGGSFEEACQRVSSEGPQVLATHGPQGAYAFGAVTCHLPARAVKVVDTTGAGDSFAGAVMADILAGRSLEEAVARGIRVAGYIIGLVGARPMKDIRAL